MRRTSRARAVFALACSLATALTACKSVGETVGNIVPGVGDDRPQYLTVQLVGDSAQNAVNGNANPVVVRFYQLADRGKFDQASAAALWRSDTTALGADLVTKTELTLLPRGKATFRLDITERARFVAVAANFYSPDADGWRRVQSLTSRKNVLRVHVRQRQLSID